MFSCERVYKSMQSTQGKVHIYQEVNVKILKPTRHALVHLVMTKKMLDICTDISVTLMLHSSTLVGEGGIR